MQVPQDVQMANKLHQEQQQREVQNQILNNVPGLENDRDRQNFVVKVYSIITVMLAATGAWCFYVYENKSLQHWIYTNLWSFYLALILTIVLSCVIMCSYKLTRKAPGNFILLGLYTAAHSYLIGAIIPQYEAEVIVAAALCTFAMFIGLTVYACFTKTDMTKMGGFLVTLTMMVFMFFILNWILRIELLYLVLVVAVILLVSVWIVHDTQIIVGGKHRRYQLEVDDYIIGALIIYSDIITLFIYILQIFGGGSN